MFRAATLSRLIHPPAPGRQILNRKLSPTNTLPYAQSDPLNRSWPLGKGMTPEMLSKMVSNPELMVLMQNPKLQEIMKKVRREPIVEARACPVAAHGVP